MSYLASMLQAASTNAARLSYDKARKVARHKASMEARSKRVWGEVFAALGGKATTNQLAGHKGRSAPSILGSMYDLEEKGWVRRAGTVLKSGRPGNNIIVWEWLL